VNPRYTPPCQAVENLVPSKCPSYQSSNTIALWLKLFSDILNNEHLAHKLWNTIDISLGVEGNVEGSIVVNIPEINVG